MAASNTSERYATVLIELIHELNVSALLVDDTLLRASLKPLQPERSGDRKQWIQLGLLGAHLKLALLFLLSDKVTNSAIREENFDEAAKKLAYANSLLRQQAMRGIESVDSYLLTEEAFANVARNLEIVGKWPP
jgi:hypothetical protein